MARGFRSDAGTLAWIMIVAVFHHRKFFSSWCRSFRLTGFGHGDHLCNIEAINVVDQFIGENILGIQFPLDHFLLEQPVADGEFMAIVGPSGCGKTTVLKILAGSLVGFDGRAYLKGTPIAKPRRDINDVAGPVLRHHRRERFLRPNFPPQSRDSLRRKVAIRGRHARRAGATNCRFLAQLWGKLACFGRGNDELWRIGPCMLSVQFPRIQPAGTRLSGFMTIAGACGARHTHASKQ